MNENWRKVFLIGVGWGLGTAVGLVILVGGFLWYQSRPKPLVPPKPWNTAAIKAEYDETAVEQDLSNMSETFRREIELAVSEIGIKCFDVDVEWSFDS